MNEHGSTPYTENTKELVVCFLVNGQYAGIFMSHGNQHALEGMPYSCRQRHFKITPSADLHRLCSIHIITCQKGDDFCASPDCRDN